MNSRIVVLACLAISACALTGCGGKTTVENRSTTIGQELQDLEEARNKGLITESEYSKKREQIMKRK